MSGASDVLSGQPSFEVPVGNTMAGQHHPACQRDTSMSGDWNGSFGCVS